MEPYLPSLLTFFLGFFIGQRLALTRDSGKEFNEIAQAIRALLLKERFVATSDRSTPIGLRAHCRLEGTAISENVGIHIATAKSDSHKTLLANLSMTILHLDLSSIHFLAA